MFARWPTQDDPRPTLLTEFSCPPDQLVVLIEAHEARKQQTALRRSNIAAENRMDQIAVDDAKITGLNRQRQ